MINKRIMEYEKTTVETLKLNESFLTVLLKAMQKGYGKAIPKQVKNDILQEVELGRKQLTERIARRKVL